MSDRVETLRSELRYWRDRRDRARTAFRHHPHDPAVDRWLTNAEEMADMWERALERAEIEEVGGGHAATLTDGLPVPTGTKPNYLGEERG